MPWDVLLHIVMRTVAGLLALTAFAFGARQAMTVMNLGLRRILRLFGALLLLGFAGLTGMDAALAYLDGKEVDVNEGLRNHSDALRWKGTSHGNALLASAQFNMKF